MAFLRRDRKTGGGAISARCWFLGSSCAGRAGNMTTLGVVTICWIRRWRKYGAVRGIYEGDEAEARINQCISQVLKTQFMAFDSIPKC